MEKLLFIKNKNIKPFFVRGVFKGKIVNVYDGDTCKIVILNGSEL